VAYDTWYDKETYWKNFCYIQERWKLAIIEKNIYEYISLVYVWATKVKGSHCQVEHIIKSLEVS
jgi:hypothetical protein